MPSPPFSSILPSRPYCRLVARINGDGAGTATVLTSSNPASESQVRNSASVNVPSPLVRMRPCLSVFAAALVTASTIRILPLARMARGWENGPAPVVRVMCWPTSIVRSRLRGHAQCPECGFLGMAAGRPRIVRRRTVHGFELLHSEEIASCQEGDEEREVDEQQRHGQVLKQASTRDITVPFDWKSIARRISAAPA